MRQIYLLLLALLLVAASIITWQLTRVQQEASNDIETIYEASHSYFQADFMATAKWSDEAGEGYASLTAFQTYNALLSHNLGIQPSTVIDYENGLPVLRGSSPFMENIQLQSMLVGSKDQKSSLWILQLIASSIVSIKQMVQAQQNVNLKLTEMGFHGAWNTTLQGTLDNKLIVNHPETFIRKLGNQLQGLEQELYQENGTASISLFSKQLHTSIQSGNHRINLQIALHQNSVTKKWRLTVGSPLITMEY